MWSARHDPVAKVATADPVRVVTATAVRADPAATVTTKDPAAIDKR